MKVANVYHMNLYFCNRDLSPVDKILCGVYQAVDTVTELQDKSVEQLLLFIKSICTHYDCFTCYMSDVLFFGYIFYFVLNFIVRRCFLTVEESENDDRMMSTHKRARLLQNIVESCRRSIDGFANDRRTQSWNMAKEKER